MLIIFSIIVVILLAIYSINREKEEQANKIREDEKTEQAKQIRVDEEKKEQVKQIREDEESAIQSKEMYNDLQVKCTLMQYMMEAVGFPWELAFAHSVNGVSLSNPNNEKTLPLHELEVVNMFLENYYPGMIIYHVIESKVDDELTYSFCYVASQAYDGTWRLAKVGVACIVEIKLNDIYNLRFAPFLRVKLANINVKMDGKNLKRIDYCQELSDNFYEELIDASWINKILAHK